MGCVDDTYDRRRAVESGLRATASGDDLTCSRSIRRSEAHRPSNNFSLQQLAKRQPGMAKLHQQTTNPYASLPSQRPGKGPRVVTGRLLAQVLAPLTAGSRKKSEQLRH